MSAAPAIVPSVVVPTQVPGRAVNPDLPTLPNAVRAVHPHPDYGFGQPDFAGTRVGRDGVLVVPASRMEKSREPITIATGISAFDQLTGGIPRGALTEICGPASSGRTSVLLSLMAQMT